jgi:heavy metal translocating P-type ATPase
MEIQKTQVKIGGMMCSFCSQTIEKAMMRTSGVKKVNVSLAHEEALIEHDPGVIEADKIKKILRGLGYTVRDPRKIQHFEEEDRILKRELNRMIFGWSFAIAATVFMVLGWLDISIPHQKWIMLGMATITVFGGGAHILKMSFLALRRWIFNQHVLLTFGALGAYATGIVGFFYSIPDTFPPAIYLTAFHLLSGYLSGLVRTRSSQAVRRLLSLQPLTAFVVKDGGETEIPVAELKIGDRVRVRPGERIPVDGKIIEGISAIDQSLVTGESIPVDKGPGDSVIGASLNQLGSLLIEVTRVGEDTFLQRVARYVEEAKALKPGIIILADRVLGIYVPSVIIISIGSFLFWYFGMAFLGGKGSLLIAVYAALSVLIIGYPCALGMATPLALIRGSGLGAQKGILMRSGEAFQTMKDVKKVVLDKTGTITMGQPRVTEIIPMGSQNRDSLLQVVASAESRSEHPLAKAIVEEAKDAGLTITEIKGFKASPGFGIEASLDGKRVLVGNTRFMTDHSVNLDPLEEKIKETERKGKTAILAAVNGVLAGLIGISDQPKEDATDSIAGLRKKGLIPLMITGDNPRAASSMASRVGIDEVLAQVLPDQKADKIREIQSQGIRVAMVGDGINDAPALMQADIGIAIGAGTDIAIESSDVILVRGELMGVLDAFDLSINTYRKIRQNLLWAFLFNGVGIPVAATGILHPLMAMTAMVLSTSAIMVNSFGSRFITRKGIEEEEKILLSVPGIHCQGCVDRIRDHLVGQKGIQKVEGNPTKKTISVVFERQKIEKDRIKQAIVGLGYPLAD